MPQVLGAAACWGAGEGVMGEEGLGVGGQEKEGNQEGSSSLGEGIMVVVGMTNGCSGMFRRLAVGIAFSIHCVASASAVHVSVP